MIGNNNAGKHVHTDEGSAGNMMSWVKARVTRCGKQISNIIVHLIVAFGLLALVAVPACISVLILTAFGFTSAVIAVEQIAMSAIFTLAVLSPAYVELVLDHIRDH